MTEQQKAYFLKVGYLTEDLPQLEEAMKMATLKVGSKRIGKKEAISLLGEEVYLSGISRAAFHWTCSRDIPDSNQSVSFDCSRMFR